MSSGVELPLVPSARSSASATSLSGRRSLHSAGSTASYTSAKSFKKSSEGESEADEEDSDEGEELEEPDEPSHTSAGGIWDEVESFLSKPSPSFAALSKPGSSKQKTTVTSMAHTLPTLKSGAGERRHPVAPASGGSNQARANRPSRIVTKLNTSSSKSIDPRLLQEAFAYAEKIQKVNFDDDDDEDEGDQQREAERRERVETLRRDGSSSGVGGSKQPSFSHEKSEGSINIKKKKSSTSGAVKSSAYGAPVKPQPTKKKPVIDRRAVKEPADWDSTPSSADPSGEAMSRKGSFSGSMMDQQTVQALVSNFQNGTTLDELRKELVASQQSMAFSRQVIQEAAKSFFQARK